ncbi:hypothetical protein KGP36_01750 [Patescibacteria group bacterium]|nr:hypothetical protein [Patescibacteria group bacterium]
MQYAGKEVSALAVSETARMLRYYRRFIREGLPGQQCRDLEDEWRSNTFTKEQAQQRLSFLVNVAINRKAGLPDITPEEEEFRNPY